MPMQFRTAVFVRYLDLTLRKLKVSIYLTDRLFYSYSQIIVVEATNTAIT